MNIVKELKEQIKDFQQRRFAQDNNWTTGNCYWYAQILQIRFPQLDIYYQPINNHWIAGNKNLNIYADWDGIYTFTELQEKPILWTEYVKLDFRHALRLIKQCIY